MFGYVIVLSIALLQIHHSLSFSLNNEKVSLRNKFCFSPMVISSTKLSMAGGRSPSEKNMTTRMMFKDLREKLNTAAKVPGFFEVSQTAEEIELYCKSNKDGSQIGDCPGTQFIQLVLMKKGISYVVKPTLPTSKPDWLLEKFDGKLPCIVHKPTDTKMIDSLAIAEFIEKMYPHNTLTRQGAYSYQEVLEKTAGFFPSLSKFIKNKDDSKDAELLEVLETELDTIDMILRTSPGVYMCGIEMTLADLYLIPQLFHAMVTMEHFKGVQYYHIDGEATRPSLERYVARMFDLEEFNNKRAYYNVDQVVYGWKQARGETVMA